MNRLVSRVSMDRRPVAELTPQTTRPAPAWNRALFQKDADFPVDVAAVVGSVAVADRVAGHPGAFAYSVAAAIPDGDRRWKVSPFVGTAVSSRVIATGIMVESAPATSGA
jgi:hypothetical protein